MSTALGAIVAGIGFVAIMDAKFGVTALLLLVGTIFLAIGAAGIQAKANGVGFGDDIARSKDLRET